MRQVGPHVYGREEVTSGLKPSNFGIMRNRQKEKRGISTVNTARVEEKEWAQQDSNLRLLRCERSGLPLTYAPLG